MGIAPQDCILVILASGLSKRFGSGDKLLAPFLGKPLCTHILNTLAPIPFAQRFAVLPENCPDRTAHFQKTGFQLIPNPHPEKGRGYSVMLAAQALKAQTKHICITLADMPFIDCTHIHKLLTQTNTSVTMSAYDGIFMPPAIFAPNVLPELATSPNARKQLLKTEPVQSVTLSRQAATDIDTKEGLRMLEARMRS